jgi:kynurenine formamidase
MNGAFMRLLLLILVSIACWAGSADAIDDKKLIDMTYVFSHATLHWPTAQPFRLERVSEGRTPQGFWYSSYNYGGSEHVGTHLDAPFHFAEGKWTTEQIPLSQTIGPGIVLDVGRKVEGERDYQVQVNDILDWERTQGRIPKGTIVLLRTGWGKNWGDPRRYFGTAWPGDVENLHFPGLSKEAAELLLQRGIKAVGIDTPSIDHGPSRDFPTHRVFAASNIPIFENVAALDRVPVKGATIFAIPMKIQGGSGAPLRIFALLP